MCLVGHDQTARGLEIDAPPCKSEEFALDLGGWTLTYELDLARRIAVMRRAISDLALRWPA